MTLRNSGSKLLKINKLVNGVQVVNFQKCYVQWVLNFWLLQKKVIYFGIVSVKGFFQKFTYFLKKWTFFTIQKYKHMSYK